jgi:hypothetical protein
LIIARSRPRVLLAAYASRSWSSFIANMDLVILRLPILPLVRITGFLAFFTAILACGIVLLLFNLV